MSDNEEIKNILKESLLIIDKLATFDMEILDHDIEILEELIKRAKKLKSNRLWKLK